MRWIAIIIVGTVATGAEANPEAEQLFRDGRAALKALKLDEACELFARSYRIEASITTLLNLGECHEQAGRTASAWDAFVRARTLALETSDPRRAVEAERRAKVLEGKLGKLTLVVPASTPRGFAIKRCGTAIEQASWNVALPVDPGACRVEATAPGYKTWTGAANVEAAKQAMLLVEVPAVDPDAPKHLGPTPASIGATGPLSVGVLVGAGNRENVLIGARMQYATPMPGGQLRVVASAFFTNYVDDSRMDMTLPPRIVDLHTRAIELAVGVQYLYFPIPKLGLGGGLGLAVDFDDPGDDEARLMLTGEPSTSDVGGGFMLRGATIVRISRRLETGLEIQLLKNSDEYVFTGMATLDWFP